MYFPGQFFSHTTIYFVKSITGGCVSKRTGNNEITFKKRAYLLLKCRQRKSKTSGLAVALSVPIDGGDLLYFWFLFLDCGERNEDLRVVGGSESEVSAYPWIARLIYHKSFGCGASLINDRYVISAAHCVKGYVIS